MITTYDKKCNNSYVLYRNIKYYGSIRIYIFKVFKKIIFRVIHNYKKKSSSSMLTENDKVLRVLRVDIIVYFVVSIMKFCYGGFLVLDKLENIFINSKVIRKYYLRYKNTVLNVSIMSKYRFNIKILIEFWPKFRKKF